jgi:hypothetical protein
MKIDGACHCGYIRVEGEADPEKTTVCHCTDCQASTGSAFRVNKARQRRKLPARFLTPSLAAAMLQRTMIFCDATCGTSDA